MLAHAAPGESSATGCCGQKAAPQFREVPDPARPPYLGFRSVHFGPSTSSGSFILAANSSAACFTPGKG